MPTATAPARVPRLLLLAHSAFNRAVDARASEMQAAAAAEEKSARSDVKAGYGGWLARFHSEAQPQRDKADCRVKEIEQEAEQKTASTRAQAKAESRQILEDAKAHVKRVRQLAGSDMVEYMMHTAKHESQEVLHRALTEADHIVAEARKEVARVRRTCAAEIGALRVDGRSEMEVQIALDGEEQAVVERIRGAFREQLRQLREEQRAALEPYVHAIAQSSAGWLRCVGPVAAEREQATGVVLSVDLGTCTRLFRHARGRRVTRRVGGDRWHLHGMDVCLCDARADLCPGCLPTQSSCPLCEAVLCGVCDQMHRDECDNDSCHRCGVDVAGRRRVAGHCHKEMASEEDLVQCGATASWGASSSATWHEIRTGGRAQTSCAVRSCVKCLVECKGAHSFDLDEMEDETCYTLLCQACAREGGGVCDRCQQARATGSVPLTQQGKRPTMAGWPAESNHVCLKDGPRCGKYECARCWYALVQTRLCEVEEAARRRAGYHEGREAVRAEERRMDDELLERLPGSLVARRITRHRAYTVAEEARRARVSQEAEQQQAAGKRKRESLRPQRGKASVSYAEAADSDED